MKKTMSVYYDDYFLFMLRLFVKLCINIHVTYALERQKVLLVFTADKRVLDLGQKLK